ncbi:MAG: glycosyltransferase family 2 protein, partial [Candidatus Korobacteraceae bacterium]
MGKPLNDRLKLSFVVSTCGRPKMLPVVLHCLAAQTLEDFEVIVTDNSDPEAQAVKRNLIEILDSRFDHLIKTQLPV